MLTLDKVIRICLVHILSDQNLSLSKDSLWMTQRLLTTNTDSLYIGLEILLLTLLWVTSQKMNTVTKKSIGNTKLITVLKISMKCFMKEIWLLMVRETLKLRNLYINISGWTGKQLLQEQKEILLFRMKKRLSTQIRFVSLEISHTHTMSL